jgi:hydroxypyruvate reductase
VTPVILGDSIEGESRDVALVHAAIARQCTTRGQPERPPCVLISGGETTITLKGKGKGGRNTEFLLALTIALQGLPGVYALAGDTDGIDGSEDNAGALVTPDTLARAEKAGLNPKAMLADNDPWNFFNGLGDLLVTGPTLTNVNDFRAILIERRL